MVPGDRLSTKQVDVVEGQAGNGREEGACTQDVQVAAKRGGAGEGEGNKTRQKQGGLQRWSRAAS